MTETTLPRVFKYDDRELPDPNPNHTVAQVLDFYSNEYPELTSATAKEKREDGRVLYEVSTNMGTKG